MKITAKQASEILKVSSSSVRKLVKLGHLKDYGVTAKGKQKHALILDFKEVRELKSSKPTIQKHSFEKVASARGELFGILSRIEGKVNKLLAIWS